LSIRGFGSNKARSVIVLSPYEAQLFLNGAMASVENDFEGAPYWRCVRCHASLTTGRGQQALAAIRLPAEEGLLTKVACVRCVTRELNTYTQAIESHQLLVCSFTTSAKTWLNQYLDFYRQHAANTAVEAVEADQEAVF
jgi:hypothetical protein